MNELELNQLVDTWIEATGAETESNWWAIEQVIDWDINRQGELLWRFVMAAYKRDLSDKAVGSLAAGPLEDLLGNHGPEYIERVEELARKDPKFNFLLGGVWRNSMTDEVWQRVQAARLHVW
jgi:hypothetical protein